MIDIGVARPSAQGQAMISTDTAATSPIGEGAAPARRSPRREGQRSAMAITAGTNQPDDLVGQPLDRRAASAAPAATIWTMRASMVSRPTFSARMTKAPVVFIVPPITLGAGLLGDRHGLAGDHRFVERRAAFASPRRRPAPSRPAARAAGRRPRSASSATSSSVPSSLEPPRRLRRQVEQRADGAAEVCSRARSSSTWPSSTSTVITAAASK